MRPASITEAIDHLDRDEEATLIAGGQSLVPMLNLRLARPSTLVDISGISGLSGIEAGPGTTKVGALTPHSTMEAHAWPEGLSALPRGVSNIGYPAVRHRGTLGGSLAHADPAAELPTLMVALDAEFELRSPTGSRSIAADDFFVGYYSTARAHNELLTSVSLMLPEGLRTGFAEFSRRVGDFAIALAAVASWDDEGHARARVVVGGLDVRPRRIEPIESALANGEDWQALCTPGVLADFTDPTDDIHGSAGFRLTIGAEMVRRAIGDMKQVDR